MRWRILITLLHKEALRHLASRGAIVLVLLLIGASVTPALLASGLAFSLTGKVDRCFIDYWQDGPWLEHLRANVQADLQRHITFRAIERVAAAGETIYYPAGAGAIQVRAAGNGISRYEPRDSSGGGKIWVWYPGTDADAMARFEAWFWRETARYYRLQGLSPAGSDSATTVPELEVAHSSLEGSADGHTTSTTALVLFALFLTCVYLLPSWMCEEREHGLLLAVALSPATPLEMVAARCLFCAALGIGLASLVAAVSCPAALSQFWFWIALLVAAIGAAGIGSTIGCAVRKQRTASLAVLGYLLVVAGALSACQTLGLSGLSWLALEYHLPRIVYAALRGTVEGQGAHVAAASVLALAWLMAAATLFRRRGWQ